MAFIEYLIHRWLMHADWLGWTGLKFFNHVYHEHKFLHHNKYYKKFNEEPDPYGRELNIELDLKINVAIMAIAIALPIGLFVSWLFAGILICVTICHHIIWNVIHREMHIPSGSWLSRRAVYKWLARYHYIHHRYPGRNFQIVIPIFDYVFGTHFKPLPRDVDKMRQLGLY